ncbi:MAG TPA: DUF2237 domain-containing protein [Chthonomonadaceae bacterium]|nr:DUF2237 domain-containing protein [Chthonomonadaceae bacterium]
MPKTMNVLGGDLEPCSMDPLTGFYRNGCCDTGPEDHGLHLVCIQATRSFLEFSRFAGNDLSTPIPEFNFPGVKAGDRWCLCAERWQQALEAGHAPPVVLASTHVSALEWVRMDDLVEHAVDPPDTK